MTQTAVLVSTAAKWSLISSTPDISTTKPVGYDIFQQLVYEELFRIPSILESSSGIRRGGGGEDTGILESSSGIRGGGGRGR